MILRAGTSGFQYDEWKGLFYPGSLAKSRMLEFYAGELSATEINYTFRNIPSEKTIIRWLEAVPESFRFSLKAPQQVTHFARLRDCAETLEKFAASVDGLGAKKGPVLFQLPPNFKKDAGLLRAFLETMPGSLRAAFEFRHESWFDDEIYSVLKAGKAALCIADSGVLQTPRIETADFGYLRLRSGDYTDAGIGGWAEYLQSRRRIWKEAYAIFKHEETASGPRFARALTAAMPGSADTLSQFRMQICTPKCDKVAIPVALQ